MRRAIYAWCIIYVPDAQIYIERIINKQRAAAVVRELSQADFGTENENCLCALKSWISPEHEYRSRSGRYILRYNPMLNYVALYRRVYKKDLSTEELDKALSE